MSITLVIIARRGHFPNFRYHFLHLFLFLLVVFPSRPPPLGSKCLYAQTYYSIKHSGYKNSKYLEGNHDLVVEAKMIFDIEQYRAIITLLESMDQKWAFYILFTLFINRTMGFNDLKRKVKPITSKTLSQRLKQLQGNGLIRKETIADIPKRVEYRLTMEGEKMISFFVDLFGSKVKT